MNVSKAAVALGAEQHAVFARDGHVTVEGVFSKGEMDAAIEDVHAWGGGLLPSMGAAERAWFLEGGAHQGDVLRKLDDPVFHRPVIRRLAQSPALVGLVESVIGPGVSVFFSQIFFKPPHGGGPKPVHQDNFYFGPADLGRVVTAWIAMDDADLDNGCLWFGNGSNQGPVLPHVAPDSEPFNLQVVPEIAATIPMTPAPVRKGGVSFHHGNTLHQSADNNSSRWRRAAAVHFISNDNPLVSPALAYAPDRVVKVS